ncbi:MAG: zinc ribbon domain-containing protein [Candidatus Eisenbacteria bacterium]|nr:zinc ribbon domain-containing protein [Candidatus Eisenbacteria bacterium]
MPLYEYGCPGCRHAWESLQDRWDSPAPACPQCGATRSERRLSTFAVVASSASRSATAPGPCGSSDCACRRDAHQD